MLVPLGVVTVTSTMPVPAGLVAVIVVASTTVKAAVTAPNLTPVAPVKFVPRIVTEVPPPSGPAPGTIDVTVGAGRGPWKVQWSLALVALVPPGVVTVMSTIPLPAGLVARMSVSERMTNVVAAVVPNVTAVAAVRPLPVMYTTVPGGPVFGPTAVTTGAGDAVYVYMSFALIALVPPAVTTVTSTAPGECVGLITWMSVSPMTTNPVGAAAAAAATRG
jgi:hypothetical protein